MASPSAFTPASISGGVFWLDASDASTITESGGAVSAWADKFFGRSFTQDTAGAKPGTGAVTLNGMNVVTFDGGDYVTYDHGGTTLDISPFTFFAVFWDSNTGGGFHRLQSCRANGNTDQQAGNAIMMMRNGGNSALLVGNGQFAGGGAYTANAWHRVRSSANGTTGQQAIDGVAGTPASANFNPSNQRYLRFGSECMSTGNPPGANAGFWLGRLAEAICYNADLSVEGIANVEGYLQTKWGL